MNNTIDSDNRRSRKSKLFKLKEWLTVPEAAQHLSSSFDEEISESDMLRLSLDGHLRMSVYFANHTPALRGQLKDSTGAEFDGSWSFTLNMTGEVIDSSPLKNDTRFIPLDIHKTVIRGVWDLSMVGSEWNHIANNYQELSGGSRITCPILTGVLVRERDGEIYQILESWEKQIFQPGSTANRQLIEESIAVNFISDYDAVEMWNQHEKDREEYLDKIRKNPEEGYYPSYDLPEGSILVVRTQALLDLEERLMQEEVAKKKTTIGLREEKTYLNIIGAMLEVLKGSHGKVKITSEADLKDLLVQKYDGFYGLSVRTLSEKFALAKKAIREELD